MSDSSLKPTTAMKRVMRSRNDWGASDETLLRRWQVKWKANHTVYLAAAHDRAESLRRAAEAPSWVQTLRQWDEAIKALQNSPTLRQWDEMLKGLQPEHAAENARAGDLRLTEDDFARIDEAFPLGHRTRALPVM